MTRWRENFPYEGDMSGIEEMVVALRLSESRATAMAEGMSAGRGQMLAAWGGGAADRWDAMTLAGNLRMLDMAGRSAAGAVAAQAYVDAVAGIRRSWNTVMGEVLEIQAEGRRHGVESTFDLEVPFIRVWEDPDWDMGDPGTPRPVSTYSVRADLERQFALIGELNEERRAADAAMVAGMEAMVPPSWAGQRAALVAAGFESGDFTAVNLASAMGSRVESWLGDGVLQGDEMAVLGSYVGSYGHDPALMEVFFRSLGPAGSVEVIDALGAGAGGADDDGTHLRLAQAFRTSFALASAMWNADEAKSWADGLIEAGTGTPGGFAALGWLCGDSRGAVIGVRLASALADGIDTWERVEGTGMFTGWSPPSGAMNLALLEAAEKGSTSAIPAGSDPARILDTPGRIFEQLGQYPDAALDWLTDPDSGRARIGYWFSERDWTRAGDQFEGPLALLAGAADPANLTLDANGNAVTADWQRVARTLGLSLNALRQNESLMTADREIDTGSLSPQSVQYLAQITANVIPSIESGWGEAYQNDLSRSEDPFYDGSLYPVGVTAPLVAVDGSFGQALLRSSGSTSGGAVILSGGFEDYRQGLVLAALSSGSSPSIQLREVEKRLGHLSAMVAVQADAGMIDAAQVRDARVDEGQSSVVSALLYAGGTAAAMVYAPATVIGAGAYAASVGSVQTIVGGLAAGTPCTDNLDQTRTELTGVIDDRYDRDRLTYLRTAQSLLGITLPDPPAGAKIGSAAWETWYQDARGRVNAAEHAVTGSPEYDVQDEPARIKSEAEAQ